MIRSIFPIILILGSILGFFFYVMPVYTEVNELRAKVVSHELALSNLTELQKKRDSLFSSFKTISDDDKDRLVKFLPNSVNNIELILEVQQIASSHSLAIKNISFLQPIGEVKKGDEIPSTVANATYGVFDLDFSVKATYAQFLDFLKDIEKNLRLVDVVSVSFTGGSNPSTDQAQNQTNDLNTDDPNAYDFKVKIKTYWLKR